MTASEVKQNLDERLDRLVVIGDQVAHNFDIPLITEFKANLKFIRLFYEFIRLQTNDNSKRLPDACRNIYNIAGAMLENVKSGHNTQLISDKLKADWKKHYSANHFEKLKKSLSENDWRDISPVLFDNFYRHHITPYKNSVTVY